MLKNIWSKIKKFFSGKIFLNFILFPLIILIFTDIFYKINTFEFTKYLNIGFIDAFSSAFLTIKSFLFIYIVLCVINFIISAIFNNSKVAQIIIMLFFIIILPISDIKMAIMSEPIMTSDVNYLNPSNVGLMGSTFSTLKGSWMIQTLIKTLILLGIFIFISVKFKKYKFSNWKKRLINSLISLCIIILFFFPATSIKKFLITNIYDQNNQLGNAADSLDVQELYYTYGFIPGLYYNHISREFLPPDNYSAQEVRKMVESAEDTNINDWGKPNVVFLLSESFWNIQKIEEVDFDKNLTSNLDYFKENNLGLGFEILVNAHGGGTANTEFEILTGATLSFFNPSYIPYNLLYNNKSGSLLPNIVQEFNDSGYITKYLSPWSEASFRSEYVYNLVGMSESKYGTDFPEATKKGAWVSDEYMMDVIIEELETTTTDSPKFLFVATGQNHMPWAKDRYEQYDINITNSTLSDADNAYIRAYAQGIYDADKELGRLYEEICNIDTPTIIVFFGDHLPYLMNDNGEDILDKTTYFNTDSDYLNIFRKFNTECMILSNYNIEHEDIDTINASYISSYILSHLDIEVSDYFNYLNTIRPELPVFNRYFAYLNDEFLNIKTIPQDLKEIYENAVKVQYSYFLDY